MATPEIASHDADDVEHGGEQREGYDRGRDSGTHEIGHGIDVHDVQGVNLIRDAHDAYFGSHAGSGASGEHDSREHGTELADEGQRDHGSEEAHGSEFNQRVVALQTEHKAAEEADEHDEKEGLGSDDVELLEGSREDLRAREDLPHPFQKEEHEAAHEAEAAEAGRPEPGTEVSGHVEHLPIASSWKAAWEHRDRRT